MRKTNIAIVLACLLTPLYAQMIWKQATATPGWSARYSPTSVVHDGKMWVLGGHDGVAALNDVWSSVDGVTWTQVTSAAGWSARYWHTSVVFAGKMWVLGGSYKNDVWYSTDGVTWTEATYSGTRWSARSAHTSVVHDGKMWVMGGSAAGSKKRDVWYSTNGGTWTQATATATWPARQYHASVAFNDKMWVMGGEDITSKNDVWYSTNGVNWTDAVASGHWSARRSPTSVVHEGKMWVLGGSLKRDAWYSTDGVTWTQATATAAWPAREMHTSVVFGGKMWVMGGWNGTVSLNDVWYCVAPAALAPTGTGIAVTGNFTWSYTGDAPDSSVIFYGAGTPARIGKTTGAVYVYTRPTAAYSTAYNWYVVAWKGTASAQATQVSFTTVPAAPTVLAPAGTGIAVTGNFTWTHTGGAPDSSVIFYGAGTPARIGKTTGAVYVYTRPTAAYSTAYNWYVVAWKDDVSASATQVSFTTIPAAPTVLAPVGTDVPVSGNHTWSYTGGTVDSFVVWRAVAPAAPVWVANTGTSPSLAYSLSNSTTYNWYVVAWKGGEPAQAEQVSFTTIVAAPVAPTLAKPDNGAENQPIDGYLHWYKADRATGYDVWLDVNETPEVRVSTNQPDTFFHYTKSNNTRYYWRVDARNIGGSAPSTVWNFTTVVPAPGAPVLLAPANNALNQQTSGVLSWQAGVGGNPSGYDVYLDVVGPPVNRVSENQVGSTYGYSGLPNGVKHYWKVVAKNAGGEEQSETRDFRVRMAAPVQTEPENHALGQPITGKLRWTDGAGAVKWTVFFGTGTTPDSVIDVTATEYEYTGTNSTKYYWKLAAKDAVGQRTESAETWDFTTIVDKPAAFGLTTPGNGQGSVPVAGNLEWGAAARAEVYDVYFKEGEEPGPGDKIGTVAHPTATLPYTGHVTFDKTYYWYVVARNVGGDTRSATVFSFTTIIEKPGTFELSKPANGEVDVPVIGLLEWEDAERKESYDVYLKEGEEPGPGDKIGSTMAHEFPYANHVGHDLTYYWYVIARNLGGYTPSTSVFHFTTKSDVFHDVGATAVIAPAGAVGQGRELFPKVTVRNYGGVPEFSVPVRVLVNGPAGAEVYNEVTTVSLDLNQEKEVVFTVGWTPAELGDYDVVGRTEMEGDAEPENDEKTGTCTVIELPPWPEDWTKVEPMPNIPTDKPVKDGGWLAVGPDAITDVDVIYAAKGNKTTDFFKYAPTEGDSGTWHTLKSIPPEEGDKTKPPSKGCVGVSDGINFVYMTKGNNTLGFWRYDVDADTWELLPGVPLGEQNKKVKGGTDMVYAVYKDTGCVFLLKGYKTEFYRYNPEAERWDTLSNAPAGGGKAKYDKGSFLVYDQAGHIYAHQAKYNDGSSHYMFRYDLQTGRWTDTLKGMPLAGIHGGKPGKNKKSKDGGAGDWFGENVFALKGGNTQQLFKYFPEGDSWQELDTVPANGSTGKKKYVKYGGDLASYGSGAFFALKGNKTFEMWRYVVPTTACGSQPTANGRSGVMAGNVEVRTSKFELFPNPIASGFATVRFSLPKAGPVAVTVFDIAGRAVLRQSAICNLQSAITLDLQKVPAGVYLVRLDTQDGTATQKLLVQHRSGAK